MAAASSCNLTGDTFGSQAQGLEQFVNIVSGVCFYGCLVSLIMEATQQRWTSLATVYQRTVQSVITLGKRFLGDPTGSPEAQNLMDCFENLMNGIGSTYSTLITQQPQNQSLEGVIWSMAKTMIARYSSEMIMAACQDMVDKMKADLAESETHLSLLEQDVNELQSAIEDLLEYDWWDDFVDAVNAAYLSLGTAKQELESAYVNASGGTWQRENVDNAQYRMAVAWQRLATDSETQEMLDEFGGYTDLTRPYNPFDPAFFRGSGKSMMASMNRLSTAVDNIKSRHDCLYKLSIRLQMYKNLLTLANEALGYIGSDRYAGFALDIMLGDDLLHTMITHVKMVMNEMHDVVENEKRLVAPFYATSWRNEIHADMEILKTFQSVPQPFNLPSLMIEQDSLDDLHYLLFPHDPKDGLQSLSEIDFSVSALQAILGRLMATAGNFGMLLAYRGQWQEDMNEVRDSIRDRRDTQARAQALLEKFDGYESTRFDYVLNLLRNSQMESAAKLLETGRITDLLSLGVMAAAATTTLSECLAPIIGGEGLSLGLSIRLEQLQAEEQSDIVARMRASLNLPSLQFKALMGLQTELQGIDARIAELNSLNQEICG